MNPQPKRKPIRFTGKKYHEFRRLVFEKYHGCCADCDEATPLSEGHVAHIKSRGSGGGDKLDNVKWKCPLCHIGKEHGPRWTKKQKGGAV